MSDLKWVPWGNGNGETLLGLPITVYVYRNGSLWTLAIPAVPYYRTFDSLDNAKAYAQREVTKMLRDFADAVEAMKEDANG